MTILHIFRPTSSTFSELQEEKQAARKLLDEAHENAVASVGKRKVSIVTQLIESEDVRNSLVSFCKGFSFVALGSTGNSGVGTFLLGSVAQ